MARHDVIDLGPRRSPGFRGFGLWGWLVLAFIALASARTFASWWIDFQWWTEVGQAATWGQMLLYGSAPSLAAGFLLFPVFWILAAKARPGLGGWKLLLVLLFSLFMGNALVDNWTVARWWGSTAAAGTGTAWRDPVFGQPIGFYFFQLPFYEMMLRFVQGVVVVGFILFWIVSRFESLREHLGQMQERESFDISGLGLREALGGIPVRITVASFFLLLAARAYLSRYDILFEDHGFLVGADYVDIRIVLPAILALVGACVLGALLVMRHRAGLALALVLVVYFLGAVIPKVVNALAVRPNEISLQRPYIEEHIKATRSAFGLSEKLKEREFPIRPNAPFEAAKHQSLLENVRLWDWQAFHDTITQIQALRPYYVFADTDVDRYRFADGQTRQVMLTPRELHVDQLPGAKDRWINPHFIYTHGYGVVMAETNKIAPDGLPQLLIKDAPPQVSGGAPKVTRPEIYYGEATHEPVFVRTAQPEFNYPSGTENVHSKYGGHGGIPVDGLLKRFVAALAEGDWNILLTDYLTADSRMLIKRNVKNRLETLAEFVVWDSDPYLVVRKDGTLMWMIDGYTTHSMHPYSRRIGRMNYIRNSVKATVDAYDGAVTLYAWDEADPILAAYRQIFPALFRPAAEMPADIREHTRFPEDLFKVQADVYRTYHMTNPESFYNREDLWDLAKTAEGADGEVKSSRPTYLLATLPGEDKPEFILLTTFTPRAKQNLVGLMAARCDGTRLGEIEVLQLSKQQLIYGPMQVAARINQDQTISKDLTLWNQKGSTVLKGQMLVLPMGDQFLYVQPIYIKADNAPMPELKKVALGFGSSIGYADTYAEALAQLAGKQVLEPPADTSNSSAPKKMEPVALGADNRLDKARSRLKRYRELMGQGKFVDAAKELEALESDIKQ